MSPPAGTRLARNTLLNLAGQGVPALIGLFAMPAIVRGLGQERLGLLGLGWVVLGYFGLMDLGLGRAAARFIADAIGRNDTAAVPGLAWSAVAMQLVVGGVGAVVLTLASGPIATMMHVKDDLRPEAIQTFHILALAIPIILVSASFRGVLEASRRFDLVNAVAIPGSSLNFLIPLIGTLSAISFSAIIALLVASRAATLLAYLTLSVRLFPALTRPQPNRRALNSLLRFGVWTTVSSVVSPVLDTLDRFLLGAFAGVASVGFYTAPQEMVLRLRAFPTALAATLFPEFSSLTAPGGIDRARRYYALSIRFLTLLLTPITLVFVWLGQDIVRVWLGDDFALKSGLALGFLAIGLLANSVAYVPYAFLHGTNRPDLPAKFHLLELPIFLAVAAILMPRYGVAGAGAVWALRAWLDATLLLVAAHRTGVPGAGENLNQRVAVWGALLAVMIVAGCLPAVRTAAPLTRLLAVLIGSALVTTMGWLTLLGPDDRARVRSTARALAFSQRVPQ